MIYTIGHSTRKEQEFLETLAKYSIDIVADIRTLPRSRWNPQFNRTSLEKSLPQSGIQYMHIPQLGGLREPSSKSVNGGLKNPALRGYADHMETPEFEQALANVLTLARKKRIALMCAEADYKKCHRQLTSDALTVRKMKVLHILNPEEATPHVLTPFARVSGNRISYPPGQSRLEF
jgi:uncharacterized protein (DUF488 family)